MKQLYTSLIFILCIATWSACSGQEETIIDTDTQLEINGFNLSVTGTEATVTRAKEDYIANSEIYDPTATLETRTGWLLDIQIYHNDAPYDDGEGTCKWDASEELWIPEAPAEIFFPNDKTQGVKATLYPTGWSDIDVYPYTDQSDKDKLLAQDILSTASTAKIIPAKKPVVTLEHHYSMLDFRLENIHENANPTITVVTYDDQDNPTIYDPYKVEFTNDEKEYLVILPTGTKNPVVSLVTAGGIEYKQIVNIENGTIKNRCYCFTLDGLELELSPVSVINWSTGAALSGENTAITAFPTFRGPKDSRCRLYFKNGLTQDITFNSQGEWTGKPAGRTITEVSVLETINNEIVETKKYILPIPKALRDMIINLANYIALAT